MDGFSWGSGSSRNKALEARIARLERMLQSIMDHLNIDYDDDQASLEGVSPTVLANIQAGNTIAAIKQYRYETGAGLAEAKALIDRIVAARSR